MCLHHMLLATDGCLFPPGSEENLSRLPVTPPPLIKLNISHLFVTAARIYSQECAFGCFLHVWSHA